METLVFFVETLKRYRGCAVEQQSATRQQTTKSYVRLTQDTTAMCRCDGEALYGVQECLHRGCIIRRAPELEKHRTALLRHLDVVRTMLRFKSCTHVMMVVGEHIAAFYAPVLGRSVAFATTRTQQRTAVTAQFMHCCVGDLPRDISIVSIFIYLPADG